MHVILSPRVMRATGPAPHGRALATAFLSLAAPAALAESAPPDALVGAGDVSQVVAALLVVLGLILAMAWAARRLLRITPRTGGAVRILSGVSMGPREKLVLVQVGSTQLLLGVAPGRIQTLHVLDEALPEELFDSGSGGRFASHLAGTERPGPASALARALTGKRGKGGAPRGESS